MFSYHLLHPDHMVPTPKFITTLPEFSDQTVSQMFMLILLIADLGSAFNMIAQVLIWVSLVLTIVSLIDYIAKNVQVLTQGGM